MPTRKRSRAQDRAYRIQRERNINAARYAADLHRSELSWRYCTGSQNRNWFPNGSVMSTVSPHGSDSRPGRANM
jgi:hypothetical protein